MGLITFPVIYFPYALIAMDLITGGPGAAACSITGILVGHLWWLGVWKTRALEGIGRAPSWLKALIGRNLPPTIPGVHVVPPRAPQPVTQRGTGYNWGSGQRLGGS
jgi:Derlin-2/3